jgi:hypothetical protein
MVAVYRLTVTYKSNESIRISRWWDNSLEVILQAIEEDQEIFHVASDIAISTSSTSLSPHLSYTFFQWAKITSFHLWFRESWFPFAMSGRSAPKEVNEAGNSSLVLLILMLPAILLISLQTLKSKENPTYLKFRLRGHPECHALPASQILSLQRTTSTTSEI